MRISCSSYNRQRHTFQTIFRSYCTTVFIIIIITAAQHTIYNNFPLYYIAPARATQFLARFSTPDETAADGILTVIKAHIGQNKWNILNRGTAICLIQHRGKRIGSLANLL